MTNEELMIKAKEAMNHSYSPYSGFSVGAAVISDTGEVFTGCNVENISYGATVCAERTAIFSCVAAGFKHVQKIAVTSASLTQTFPCGLCLQVMQEFMDENSIIILSDSDAVYEYKLSDFLPKIFNQNFIDFIKIE